MIIWTPAVLSVVYACVLCFCICTCSAKLSVFHVERRSKNTLMIITIIIIIVIVIIINCFKKCTQSRGLRMAVVVGWLLNVPATCECISGTDLLRQFYVLPH